LPEEPYVKNNNRANPIVIDARNTVKLIGNTKLCIQNNANEITNDKSANLKYGTLQNNPSKKVLSFIKLSPGANNVAGLNSVIISHSTRHTADAINETTAITV